jgi:hypothetical protein
VNASDVIDDRVVLEHGNVQYVACIVPDMDAPNPVEEFDFPGENDLDAWQNGEVYGWYLLRQVLDDDGETLESEHLDSCFGYYGDSEISYMYECATDAAERDHANREKEEAEREARDHWRATQGYLALDLFDAASYPEPTLYDVAGAYQARLNAGMESIGECTRKLVKEGYFNTGTIAIG